MNAVDVYLALGGNVGETSQVFHRALGVIGGLRGVRALEVSRFHVTEPVSPIPQRHFLNAACRFTCEMPVEELATALFDLEEQLGKRPKPKEAPRVIDIDLLLYGMECRATPRLEIPHPRWRGRAFVILPLLDLTTYLDVPISPGVIERVDLRALLNTIAR